MGSFFSLARPAHPHAEIRLRAGRGDIRASHGAQIDAEGNFDLIGFAGHAPQFLNDRCGCWQDFVQGLLKGFPGLLDLVFPASTDGATRFWFVDLDDDAAPLFQGKLYQVFHSSPPLLVEFSRCFLSMREGSSSATSYYNR